MKILQKNSGQTLIEVLIAFATLAVVVTSATLAVISSLNSAQFSKNQQLALLSAQQGMEMIRSMRENNFNSFLALSDPNSIIYYCMAKSCTSLSSSAGSCGPVTTPCQTQNADAFVRGVTIDRTASNSCNAGAATQVTVSVSWADGACSRGTYCHTSSVASCLAPIHAVLAP